MKTQKLPSGLVIPAQKKEKPERKYGVLELRDEDSRKEASKAFNTLLNLPEMRSTIIKGDSSYLADLIYCIAELMLGKDWGCEIKC